MGTDGGVALFESAAKIHPRLAHGRYAKLRVAAMSALLGFYYVTPWISIGGTPLVWLDLPHRHFHVFGLELVPQDLYLLSWLLLLAALTLFLFTSLAGRLWCGYACPQTVWTEAFLWIEHLIEGDRHARIKLDRAPWSANKIARKSAKHAAWAASGLLTGLTFVAYFVPAHELFPAALHGELTGWPLFWGLFYGFATWGNAGFLREQVCKYMCPYARFQSAMFDRDTLIISYDAQRGEPRKSAAKKLAKAGDCVDCSMCVQVCPAGIDIRKGLQYECIACAACIDACNGVMDSVHKPRGLIRYTTLRSEKSEKFRLLRGRTIGYGAVWLVVACALGVAIFLRTPLEFDVIRDRHSLYRELADETVENVYTVKLANQDRREHDFLLSARLPDGRALALDPSRVHLDAGEQRAVTLSARAPEEDLPHVSKAEFAIVADDAPRLARERTASFLSGD
ncbi:MAG TPA: cytochrome c oxidase accessory protein CcoG [Nevskiaceae bacterium]|nr:cytochrome c oxidase accessory protein CcoG [Nevskiaceae bacterium]